MTASSRPSHLLAVSKTAWMNLRRLPNLPLIRRATQSLDRTCVEWCKDRTIQTDETGHNWHLIRARILQTRVVSLLVQYGRTGNRLFRQAALDYICDMAGWEYWSWITWRDKNTDYNAIFDLSYGENSMTLALAYDWLADELEEPERELIIQTARHRALIPYLALNGEPGHETWYFRKADCNWNTVCNGGVGLLALALGDAAPESARVLERVEEGIRPYFEFLGEDGAWPEGIGYWGYGHRYGYWYLLSREAVDGKPHPLLQRDGSQATLLFPFLFSPHGVGAGFGDANVFFPLPFIYAAATRYQQPDIIAELDRRLLALTRNDTEKLNASGPWPGVAELLLFHPGRSASRQSACPWPKTPLMKGLDWACLADRWPQPRLYASIRGGSTDAPHTHQDLTDLRVIVNGEPLITNLGMTYLDSTFGKRRFELYENAAASKNVMLVNGVGIPHPAAVKTQRISGPRWEGFSLDATAVQNPGTPVKLSGRIVLMLARGKALLVIDRLSAEHAASVETRFHTFGRVKWQKQSALITGKSDRLHLAFASSTPCRLMKGLGLPTRPTPIVDTVLRWISEALVLDATLATLLTPNGVGQLQFDEAAKCLKASGPGFAMKLHLAPDRLEVE